jgi:hypothetical protein
LDDIHNKNEEKDINLDPEIVTNIKRLKIQKDFEMLS